MASIVIFINYNFASSFRVLWCVLIIFVPTLISSQIYSPLTIKKTLWFFFNPSRPVSIPQISLDKYSSTGEWLTYGRWGRVHILKNLSFPFPAEELPIAWQLLLGLWSQFYSKTGIWSDLDLHEYYTCYLYSCEFICAAVLLCLQDTQ